MQHRSRSVAAGLAVMLLLASSCAVVSPEPTPSGPLASVQGWPADKRMAWYTRSQGSRLIPRDWLNALEQPGNSTPFLAPAHIETFRYLPLPASDLTSPDECPNDRGLPLGFAIDCQPDDGFSQTKLRWKAGQGSREQWVGMNCSACHTNQIDYKGQSLMVEGAPTLADFQGFMSTLRDSVRTTRADRDKLSRFAGGVLKRPPTDGDLAMLQGAMDQWAAWNDGLASLNDVGNFRYGFGRLDAIGHIYNKVALAATWPDAAAQTANPADAPVSYPFLWNVTQLDRVEWNGVAPNSGLSALDTFNYGGLGRNTGEVIGVFADLTLRRNASTKGYVSSAKVDVLDAMENQLRTLQPPTWPAHFPPIDTVLAQKGAKLFADQCSSCHALTSPTDSLSKPFAVTLSPAFTPQGTPRGTGKAASVDTDIWMACNAVQATGKTGILEGSPTELIGSGSRFKAEEPLLLMVQNAVFGTLAAQKDLVIEAAIRDLFGFARTLPTPSRRSTALTYALVSPKQARLRNCLDPKQPGSASIVYKARPLQGIWATAPYLHNGSVPTLDDLLLPPAQRPSKFQVGSREFDPVKVGFCTGQRADACTGPMPPRTFTFVASDGDGRPLQGNSNAGHDYGNALLSKGDRDALVEYMKGL